MGAGSLLGAATSFFLARHRPLVVGLALTDACNLRCVHCRVANVGARRLSMAEIEALLLDLHARGARILYLEGGEPYLWRDGAWTAASVVRCAREVGFLRVHVYTNGTRPLDAGADFHWVSIDGPPSMHRRIRGFPVDATIEHLRAHAGPAAVITTLNTLNLGVIDETLDFVERELPGRRVMFYFHTPYYGFDELLPSPAQRAAAAEHIVELKRAGRPVLNSAAGIRATASGRFRHPLPYVAVVDATGEYRCCRAIGAPEVCRHCGYSACAELELVRHLHPGALREALRYV
jgi:MoaA/NifB/PqqE/SkfB family radical SAM enzyme